MRKLQAFAKIIRPLNFIITFLSIIVAGIICNTGAFEKFNMLLAGLSGAIAAAGGNVINDYFDVEIDKVNKPSRVLPNGNLTKNEALALYFLLIIFSIYLAAEISIAALMVVVLSTVLIFLYSYRLKRIMLLGNVVVAFFTGLAFIYGGISVNNWTYALIPAVFAFMINFIREIVKDMEDIEGDKAQNILTFPQRVGFRKTVFLARLLAIFLIVLTMIPFIMGLYKIEYFIIVMLTVNIILVYFIKEINFTNNVQNFSKMSSLLKIGMIFGLAAIYMGI
jgi:geranylgeranylglycerol-phosphate geranylgeranyltransferase